MKKIVEKIITIILLAWIGAFLPFMVLLMTYINTGEITRFVALGAGALYMAVLFFLFICLGGKKK